MTKEFTTGTALTALLLLSASAHAQTPPGASPQTKTESELLRAQIEDLQNRLGAQITELQDRLKKMESAPPAAAAPAGAKTESKSAGAKKWYDTINVRGYAQLRYNRLFESNRNLRSEQGDRSIGDNGGFFLRRARLIFSGQVNDRVSFYIQPDLASSAATTNLHFAQLRDAYFDIGLKRDNELRVRIGQSKVPFGFENLQSSQNRLALDRSDGINSAFSNERDIGAFVYWAPDKIRKRFAMLVNEGLKGSGDYGVIGVGLFNGQTANKPELNNSQHWVARATYPFEVGGQIIEPHIQGYSGKFVIPTDQTSAGTILNANRNYADQRVGTGFTLYPRPFGVQAEYNWGRGPEFNPITDTIETKKLKGGYVTLSYLKKVRKHTFIPFLRYHRYEGGKKHELDARSYGVREAELGLEWQPSKQFELTAQYTLAARRAEDFARQNNFQRGRLLRVQAQVNF